MPAVSAQTNTTTETTITSISVPATVSPVLVQKVTQVAPVIMSLIDEKWWVESSMYSAYMSALEAYAAKFKASGDAKREWIANTLISYAKAYYNVQGTEVAIVEVPVVKAPVVQPQSPQIQPVDQDNFEQPPVPVVQKDYTNIQEQLDDMRALWKAQWTRNYTMVQQLWCFCTTDFTRPIKVTISNGRIKQSTANYYNWRKESVPVLNWPTLFTVEWFFDLIQDAIDQGVASIDVEFDGQRWYPTKINIDFNELIADEEKYYTITVF